MGNTLAIHWAATAHGAWLHGDPRGSWREGRLIGPDPYLETESRARMDGDAVLLDAIERGTVAEEFGQDVRDNRHRVLAATVKDARAFGVGAAAGEYRHSYRPIETAFCSRSARASTGDGKPDQDGQIVL